MAGLKDGGILCFELIALEKARAYRDSIGRIGASKQLGNRHNC